MPSYPLAGVKVNPNGQTASISVTTATGLAVSVYSDPYGANPVTLPLSISTTTAFYAGNGPLLITATVSGVTTLSQYLTLEDASVTTIAVPVQNNLTVGSVVYDLGGALYHTAGYGAKSDHKVVSDGAMTAGSAILAATTSTPFSAADLGKLVHVPGAGTSSGISTTTTGALTAGSAVSALGVNALSGPIPAGCAAVITYSGNYQALKVVSGAANATSLVVVPNVTVVDTNIANYSYPVGSSVYFAQDLTATIIQFIDSGHVMLSVAAGQTVSAQPFGWGTDDSAAIQAALTAASNAGGGNVLHRGSSMVGQNGLGTNGALLPYSDVNFTGTGEGATVLYPWGLSPLFRQTYSTTTRLTNFRMANLTIDGAHQIGPWSVSNKGVFLQYLGGCTFEDMTVQNCMATGIGCDYLALGTEIRNVKAIGNGRYNLSGANGSGSAGIGIGTGQSTVESFSISDCYVYGNGRYGIFLESQNSTFVVGPRIVNCYAEANYGPGFADDGASGATWEGCIAYNHNSAGFALDIGTVAGAAPGDHATFVGCHSYSNEYGFEYINTSGHVGAGHFSFKACRAWNNTSTGIYLAPASGTTIGSISIDNCDLELANGPGIFHNGAGTIKDLVITNSRIRANGQTSVSNNSGIKINGPVTGLLVVGNKSFDDGSTQKQTYGLEITSGNAPTLGLIADNDFRGNLTGAVLVSATLASTILRANQGYNPVGSSVPGTAFSLPATTVAWTNNTGVDGMLYVSAAGTTTAVNINGASVPIGAFVAGQGFFVPAGGTATFTYSSAPTLTFVGN